MKKPHNPSFVKSDTIFFTILIAVSIIVYWQTTGFRLLWDDVSIHLIDNPYIDRPWTNGGLGFWLEPYKKLYIPAAYTVWSILAALCRSFSFEPAFIYHLANVIVHTLNSLILFTLLRFLISDRYGALAGAVLFLVHPIQTEAVAWASELRGLLAGCFGFLSILLYLKQRRFINSENSFKYSYIRAGAGLIFFTIAVLCKPTALAAPIFAIVFDYAVYRDSFKKTMQRAFPWLIIAGVFAIVTIYVHTPEKGVYITPLWARPMVWGDSIVFYLYKLLFPFQLAPIYYRSPEYIIAQWQIYPFFLSGMLFLYLIWRVYKKNPVISYSGILFIAGFLPVSGLLMFVFQSWSTVADRYLYWSMIGAALAFSILYSNARKKIFKILIWILLLFLGSWTYFVQVPVWKDSLSLWDHCIKINNRDPDIYYNRGSAYGRAGIYYKAIDDYRKAIELKPDFAKAYHNLGVVYVKIKDYKNAIANFTLSIELRPNIAKAYNSRGIALSDIKEYKKAMADYNKALLLNPRYAQVYNNRGTLYGMIGNLSKALADYNMAISIEPRFADAYNNRGNVYAYKKNYEKAASDYGKAISIYPDFLLAYYNRARVYSYIGKYNASLADYNKSISLDPRLAALYSGRAMVFFFIKDYKRSAIDVRKALSLGGKVNPALIKNLKRLSIL